MSKAYFTLNIAVLRTVWVKLYLRIGCGYTGYCIAGNCRIKFHESVQNLLQLKVCDFVQISLIQCSEKLCDLANLQKSHLNLAKYFRYAICPDVFRFKVGFYQHSSLYFVCRYVLRSFRKFVYRYVLRSFRKLSAHSFRCVALFPTTTAIPHSLEL